MVDRVANRVIIADEQLRFVPAGIERAISLAYDELFAVILGGRPQRARELYQKFSVYYEDCPPLRNFCQLRCDAAEDGTLDCKHISELIAWDMPMSLIRENIAEIIELTSAQADYFAAELFIRRSGEYPPLSPIAKIYLEVFHGTAEKEDLPRQPAVAAQIAILEFTKAFCENIASELRRE